MPKKTFSFPRLAACEGKASGFVRIAGTVGKDHLTAARWRHQDGIRKVSRSAHFSPVAVANRSDLACDKCSMGRKDQRAILKRLARRRENDRPTPSISPAPVATIPKAPASWYRFDHESARNERVSDRPCT